jgi:branched-chain amino acid transport system substrate-binding protein
VDQEPSSYLGPGQQYRLIRLIGKGGAGSVYEAEHVGLQRRVAIKVLDPVLTRQRGFVARFQQEARAVAQLDHRHILPVFDFGEDNGRFYLVMRLVRGGSLGARLRAARDATRSPVIWLPDAALFLARQMLAALDAAHAQGIVHRDVKPDNMLIDPEPAPSESYRAFLADFGIAKLIQTDASLTQTGAMMGTPSYMAPEQVMGQAIDGRTDLYSFGVVLFELLTGRVPYTGTTPMSIAVQHVQTPLPRPRDLAPGMPQAMDALLLQALAKDPRERFATGAALVAAFERAISQSEGRGFRLGIGLPRPRIADRGTPAAPNTPTPTPTPLPVPARTQVRTPTPTSRPVVTPGGEPSQPYPAQWPIPPRIAFGVLAAAAVVVLLITVALSGIGLPNSAPPEQPATPTRAPAVALATAQNTPRPTVAATQTPAPLAATPTPAPPAATPTAAPLAAGLTGKIKIISSLPRTGANKPATDGIVDAIKLALSEVDNAIGNASLEYMDLDDSTAARGGWDPEREAANANQAVNDPDVMVYLGTLDSSASAISIPILCRANLVMISPANTNPGLSKKIDGVQPNEPDVYYPNGCKRNFARVLPTSDVQGAVAAGWAKQLGASRAYLVTNDGEGFGVYVSRSYIDYAPKIGLNVVGGPDTLSDPVALAARIKAANPDAVFFAGSINDKVVQLWQELRRSLPADVRLMGPSTFAVDPSFISRAGQAAEGTYITFPTLEPRFLTGQGADFYERMRQRLGGEPEDYAAYAYDATRAALDAIRRTGRKDRAAIRDAVFATRDFDGVLGKWSFTDSGDTTLLAMGGRQVRDGRIDEGSAVAVRAQ